MECDTYLRNVTDLLSDGKTPYERRFGQPFKGPIIPFGSLVEYYPITAKGPVKNPSIWKESFTWIVPRICIVRAGNLEGWHNDDEELETMDASEIYAKRLNAKEGDISQTRRIYFSNRRWTNQNPWRRSGTENIHLDTAATNSRRGSRWHSWRIRRVSSTTSWLISGCRWIDKWFLVHVRKLHKPPARWTQSPNFSRREKNHSLFHWNTLTSPELRTQTWMLCKKAASMTKRISMDQEICLILGQVSPSVLY